MPSRAEKRQPTADQIHAAAEPIETFLSKMIGYVDKALGKANYGLRLTGEQKYIGEAQYYAHSLSNLRWMMTQVRPHVRRRLQHEMELDDA
jgi:hypothetical protein